MNAQILILRCRFLYSIRLMLASYVLVLQPCHTAAQDANEPRPKSILELGNRDLPFAPQFRLSPDSKVVACWNEGPLNVYRSMVSRLTLWDVETGKLRFNVPGDFAALEFAPDGTMFAILERNCVSIRDVKTGGQLASLEHNEVSEARFLRNGRLLATVAYEEGVYTQNSRPSSIKFWDTVTWKQIETGIDANLKFYGPPKITSDGKSLAVFTEGSNGVLTVKVLDISSGAVQSSEPEIPVILGLSRIFTGPDANTLAIDYFLGAGVTVFWDLSTGKLKMNKDHLYPAPSLYTSFDLSGPSELANAVSVELNENKFVVREWRTDLVISEFLNPTNWQRPFDSLSGFPFDSGSHLASDKFLLLYSSRSNVGGEINIWGLDTNELKDTIKIDGPVAEIQISKDGKTLAFRMFGKYPAKKEGSSGNRVVIWNLETRREIFAFDHDDFIRSIRFSPDGMLLAIAEKENVHLRDVATGKLVCSLNSDTPDSRSLTFSPDGKHLAIGTCYDIQLWHVAQGRREWKTTGVSDLDCIEFSPDGKTLAAGSGNGGSPYGFWLINVSDGASAFNSTNDRPVNFIHFAPGGKTLSLVRSDGHLSRFDMASRKETTVADLVGGDARSGAWTCRFALLDSTNTIAAPSLDTYTNSEAEIWLCDATTGKRTGILTAPTGDIKCVLLTADGRTVVGGGAARKVTQTELEIIDLKTGELAGKLNDVMFVAGSPDGELLVTRSMTTAGLVIWKTRGGIELAKIPGCTRAQFSPDGTVLGTSAINILKLWNVADFQKGE